MKFLCDSCGTKYSISDERVRGRVLKIRCKKCDFVITVREDRQAAAAAVELPSDDDIGRAFASALAGGDEQTSVGALPGSVAGGTAKTRSPDHLEKDDWYLSFDGEQEGPFSLELALQRATKERGGDKEIHAWRPGFLVWLPIEEVPELEPARVAEKPAPRAPVRATTPTPIGAARTAPGAVAGQVARDPSGPRAALSVSAGGRSDGGRPGTPAFGQGAAPMAAAGTGAAGSKLEPNKQSAGPSPGSARPPIPAAAMSPAAPSASPLPGAPLAAGGASPGLFGGVASQQASPAAIQQMFTPSVKATGGAAADAPDLMISNEASGLVNLAHLAAAAMGKKPAGQAFINGHTGRVPTLEQEPLAALDPGESTAGTAPVVVVAGAAPRGASPLFKWAALVALLISCGLGAGVWYLLTHRPEAETIIVTEPSRRADDSPITVSDPGGVTRVVDPRKAVGGQLPKKTSVGVKPGPAPVAAGAPKPGETLSGSQRALADLYKDGGDRATPTAGLTAPGAHGAQGGQVSQAAIIAAVTANKRSLSLCYERALKHDSSLKSGRVPIQVTVGMSGRVTSVAIPEPQYASSELGQCFVQSVKRWNFPAADAAYSTEFPFILQGQ